MNEVQFLIRIASLNREVPLGKELIRGGLLIESQVLSFTLPPHTPVFQQTEDDGEEEEW
jgi:hypothetical protein